MTELPSVSNGVQHSENERKNSFLNYKSSACRDSVGTALSWTISKSINLARLLFVVIDHIGHLCVAVRAGAPELFALEPVRSPEFDSGCFHHPSTERATI